MAVSKRPVRRIITTNAADIEPEPLEPTLNDMVKQRDEERRTTGTRPHRSRCDEACRFLGHPRWAPGARPSGRWTPPPASPRPSGRRRRPGDHQFLEDTPVRELPPPLDRASTNNDGQRTVRAYTCPRSASMRTARCARSGTSPRPCRRSTSPDRGRRRSAV